MRAVRLRKYVTPAAQTSCVPIGANHSLGSGNSAGALRRQVARQILTIPKLIPVRVWKAVSAIISADKKSLCGSKSCMRHRD